MCHEVFASCREPGGKFQEFNFGSGVNVFGSCDDIISGSFWDHKDLYIQLFTREQEQG